MTEEHAGYTMHFDRCNDGIQWLVKVDGLGWSSSGYDTQAEAEARAVELIDSWEKFKKERLA